MKRILILQFVLLLVDLPGRSMLLGSQAGSSSGTRVSITRLREYSCCNPAPFEFHSGLSGPLQVVIRDSEQWAHMWERIYKTRSPLPALPELDFTRHMVVVVALGTRPTGGFGIVIDSIYERNDQLEINVVKQLPGRNCIETQSVTQPVDVVLLSRTERTVLFREKQVTYDCK